MSKYRTIVADPPWDSVTRRIGAGGRRANVTELSYPTMTLGEIAALDVDALADEDCVLFLWATRRVFREGQAVQIARAWGFEPCGEIIWGLRNAGTGSGGLANDHEPVLLARRGAVGAFVLPEPLGVYFWRQVYEWNPRAKVPQKKHSAKPTGFYELVEQISPSPYLEMFAREQRLGWDTWGNEALNHVEMTA